MKGFRVARQASTASHVAATIVQILGFWGTFLALLPWLVHAGERALGLPVLGVPQHRTIGVVLFALASVLGVVSGMTMAVLGRGTPLPLATAREFVQRGPYRVVRNPMAVAGIAQGVAVGIWLDSPAVVLYALAGAIAWHVAVRPIEEVDLAARFGAPFVQYRGRVPLWLPRMPGIAERAFGPTLLLLAASLGVRAASESWEACYRAFPTCVLGGVLGLILRVRGLQRRGASGPATAP